MANVYAQCETVRLILGADGQEWTNHEITQIASDLGWPDSPVSPARLAEAIATPMAENAD